MRVAITGGRGGLGGAVCAAAVAAGHEVISIDRPDAAPRLVNEAVTEVTADVTNFDDLCAAIDGADALVHLAAYVSPVGRRDHEVHHNNVVGSYNALGAAVAAHIARVCLASSINAIGGAYSRRPRYDYFPIDEQHATYTEDPYSLSKWIAEDQASDFARRHDDLVITSLRFHAIVDDLGDRDGLPTVDGRRAAVALDPEKSRRDLWGYTPIGAAAETCLRSLTPAYAGHEAFYLVASDTVADLPSLELAKRFYPEVPVVGDLSGRRSFFDCSKAAGLLGWTAGSRPRSQPADAR